MGGLITHLVAGFSGGLILHLLHQRFEFSSIFFIGNLLPDVIKFGFSAVVKGTFNIFSVNNTKTYIFLNNLTSNSTNWFTVGFFVLGILIFLFHYHIIKKKTFEEYDKLTWLLISGVITHLIIDALVIESSPWI